MDIILFNDGRGVPHCETATIIDGRLSINVVNAPSNAILSIVGKNNTLRVRLDASGKCKIALGEIFKNDVSFTVSADGKVWHIDGIRVTRDEDGNIFVHSLANYGKQLSLCFEEIETLRALTSKMKTDIARLLEEVEQHHKDHQLV